ncbi:MAG: hypothetical protein VB096_09665 [Pseudoflavonifractor sp.]|nr:hypothetical protein [Pseudoflavonifractor sp.]
MTETTNYHLKKPAGNDFVGPGAFNENADLIDAALQALEEGKLAADPETGKLPEAMLPPAPTAAKATPVDADWVELIDTAASNARKKLTWAGVKATLKGYFDNLYAAATHTHAWSAITGKPASYPPSAHEHAAADITSGILPVVRGGTDAADAAGARANLGACADRLSDETSSALGLTGDPTVNDALLKLSKDPVWMMITKSTIFKVADGITHIKYVICGAGGGSSVDFGGGAGGSVVVGDVSVPAGQEITCVVGAGVQGGSGGNTSFWDITATGGAAATSANGASGGCGGGGGNYNGSGGNGGNYGGGGGGGVGGSGGNGGMFGGGGGASGGNYGRSGGTGGVGGGRGGDSKYFTTGGVVGNSGTAGTITNAGLELLLSLRNLLGTDIVKSPEASSGGTPIVSTSSWTKIYLSGSGGGGMFSAGGNAYPSMQNSSSSGAGGGGCLGPGGSVADSNATKGSGGGGVFGPGGFGSADYPGGGGSIGRGGGRSGSNITQPEYGGGGYGNAGTAGADGAIILLLS